jgi:hypothetical protein
MQISAQTLLASQQTAQLQAPARAAPGFSAALEKSEGFAPLPLKQAAPAQHGPAAQPQAPARATRPGSLVDIRI